MGYAWMTLAAVLFAIMGFLGRLASAHVSWAVVAASRALVGAVVAIVLARVRGAPLLVRDRRGVWTRSVFGTLAMGATFYAIASPALTLGDATTLVNLSPVFLAVLAPLVLGEKAGRRVPIALALALSGIILILQPSFLFGHVRPGASFPALVGVLSSLSAAFAMLSLRRIGPHEGPEAIVIHYSLFAFLVLATIAARDFSVPSGKEALSVVGAGVAGGFGQVAMTRAYSIERAARVSPLSYLAIVVSALLGAVVLHEWPNAATILGMILVVAGGLVVSLVRA
jgi:drug/metabolite transporter (DMT)-like permease